MEYIFFETQDGLLCAQHCLNSLLQGDYYSAVDLANIAHELDNIERNYLSESNDLNPNQESSNYDDTGYFSIQVLQNALKQWNLELIPYASQSELAKQARMYPTEQKAYICNYKQHWYTIRKIGFYWFNLNSMFKKPELISDTYLAILLKQLETDGYSIFIVEGELPTSQADIHLSEINLNVKEILNKQNREKEDLKKTNFDDREFDDEELKKAIQMSLAENDLDIKGQELYPSLAHKSQQDYDDDDEFKRAIELSLQSNTNTNTAEIKPSTSASSSSNSSNQTESIEEIRKKRLEFLDKMKN